MMMIIIIINTGSVNNLIRHLNSSITAFQY